MSVMLGMRGTGDWSGDERPTRYREGILKIMPNGDAQLTAITSKGRNREVDDPEFKYFSKDLAAQGGAITGVYKELTLTTAYTTEATTVGMDIFVKCAEATADHFRPGHSVLLIDEDGADGTEVFGKCTGVKKNGAASYVRVQAKKTAGASVLSACSYIDIIGNVNPQGGTIPDALAYDPEMFTNYTQIFRTPLDITRTQRKTKMRIGDPYLEAKREALLYHGVEIEQSALFSEKTKLTGENGKPEYTTQGMIPFIRENAADNVSHFPSTTALTWLQAGEEWMDEMLEQLFRYGRDTKMAFCGSGALLGIMQLVKNNGQFQFTSETAAYGIKVNRWTTPFGEIMLKRHPLFTYKAHRRNSIVIFEPENVQFSYIDDTFFKKDDSEKLAGRFGYDGTKEEYLTEAGWEWHFPKTFMYLTGVGQEA